MSIIISKTLIKAIKEAVVLLMNSGEKELSLLSPFAAFKVSVILPEDKEKIFLKCNLKKLKIKGDQKKKIYIICENYVM